MQMKIEHNSAASPPTLVLSMGGGGPFKPNVAVTVLDNVPAERNHPMMGHLKARGQTVSAAGLSDAFFKEGWCEDTVIETQEENAKDGWSCISVSLSLPCFGVCCLGCNLM
jgi:hypothetical protein